MAQRTHLIRLQAFFPILWHDKALVGWFIHIPAAANASQLVLRIYKKRRPYYHYYYRSYIRFRCLGTII
jgi:hypothetical protein